MNTIDPQDFKITYQTVDKVKSIVIGGYKGELGEVAVPPVINNLPVTNIGEFAFKNMPGLRSVILPETVSVISEYAFERCTNLSSLTLPEGLKVIKKSAFANCTALRSVNFGKTVASIGENAFGGCTNLTSVALPASLSALGERVFDKCRLTEITVDEENQDFDSIEGVLFDKNGSTLLWYPKGRQEDAYTIPEHVAYIGDWAFEGCRMLKTITLPQRLVSIGNFGFAECGISAMEFPAGLTSIKNRAFYRCARFTEIRLPQNLTVIGEYAFGDCTNLETIVLSRQTKIGRGAFNGAPAQLTYR